MKFADKLYVALYAWYQNVYDLYLNPTPKTVTLVNAKVDADGNVSNVVIANDAKRWGEERTKVDEFIENAKNEFTGQQILIHPIQYSKNTVHGEHGEIEIEPIKVKHEIDAENYVATKSTVFKSDDTLIDTLQLCPLVTDKRGVLNGVKVSLTNIDSDRNFSIRTPYNNVTNYVKPSGSFVKGFMYIYSLTAFQLHHVISLSPEYPASQRYFLDGTETGSVMTIQANHWHKIEIESENIMVVGDFLDIMRFRVLNQTDVDFYILIPSIFMNTALGSVVQGG